MATPLGKKKKPTDLKSMATMAVFADLTNITQENIVRLALEHLPDEVCKGFQDFIIGTVYAATKNLCSNYSIDRQHRWSWRRTWSSHRFYPICASPM